MKRILLAAAALTLTAGIASAGPGAKSPKKPAAVSAVCPVMNAKIANVSKASGKSVYKGKTYYFCCAGCKPAFDKNPAKFAKADTKPAPAKPAKKG